jgi:hypothetical protein
MMSPFPFTPNEIPVFWVCGVTPQAVADRVRVDFMIPGTRADVRDRPPSRGTPLTHSLHRQDKPRNDDDLQGANLAVFLM